MAGLETAAQLIAKNLRDDDFFVKLVEIVDYAIAEYKDDFSDVRWKFQDSTQLRDEAIKEVIKELGFDYIRELMDTLTNVEFSALIDFLSLLNLLKGNRRGLEIVLRLLGLDSIIVEWWENSPQKEEMTFDLTVIVTTSVVPDIDATIEKIRIFIQHYVLPKLDLIEFIYILGEFLQLGSAIGGFVRKKSFGSIVGKI